MSWYDYLVILAGCLVATAIYGAFVLTLESDRKPRL